MRLQPWGELTIRKRASHGSTRSSKALFTVGCVCGQSSGEGPASPRGARRNRVEQGGELGGGQESQGRVGGCPRPPRGWARRAEDSWVGAPPGQGSGPWDPCALPTAPPSAGFPRLRPLNYRPSGLTGPVSSLTKLTHPCGAQLPEPAAWSARPSGNTAEGWARPGGASCFLPRAACSLTKAIASRSPSVRIQAPC